MSARFKILAAMILPALSFNSLAAFGASDLDPVKYDKLFPQYAELCAGSQYRDQVDGNGGPNGHGVLFLKGACRVKDAKYPQIKVCDNGPGVGISTYFAFKNVLWVATEGREFFIRGGIKPNTPVTQKEIDQVIKSAQRQGILKGVEMHDWIMKGMDDNKWTTLFGKAEDREHYKYRMSLGTDWGLGLARNLYCTRIPMTKPMLEKAVAFLNEENRKANTQGPGYENGYIWDVAQNNCMHTAYNALAAAGMWAKKQIKSSKLEVLTSKFTDGNLSLAVPFDTFLRVAVNGTRKQISNPRKMFIGGEVMTGVIKSDWMLQQPGTMLVHYPIHKNENVYFNSDSPHAFVRDQLRGVLDLTPLPLINRNKNSDTMKAIFSDSENTDLQANLYAGAQRTYNAITAIDNGNFDSSVHDDFQDPPMNQEWMETFRKFLSVQYQRDLNLIERYKVQK